MIKKLNSFSEISGGEPSLISVIKTDFLFPHSEADGVYVQQTDEGQSLLVSISGRNAAICKLQRGVDIEELSVFLQFRNIESIISDFFFEGFSLRSEYLLKAEPQGELSPNTAMLKPSSRIGEYENIFNLLSRNGDFKVWFPSFSRKINKGFAAGVYAASEDACVSCAIAPYIQGDTAVVAGVATDKAYRNKWYASLCVQ